MELIGRPGAAGMEDDSWERVLVVAGVGRGEGVGGVGAGVDAGRAGWEGSQLMSRTAAAARTRVAGSPTLLRHISRRKRAASTLRSRRGALRAKVAASGVWMVGVSMPFNVRTDEKLSRGVWILF